MRWARIENNEVREIVTHNPKDLYHPDLIFMGCPDEVKERWMYTDGIFSAPPKPQAPTESMLAIHALSQSDSSMIRIIEDLYSQVQTLKALCVAKSLFTAEEAPAIAATVEEVAAVETKLKARADLRVKVGLEVKF